MMHYSTIHQGQSNKQSKFKAIQFLENRFKEWKSSVLRNVDFKTKYFFIQMREEHFLEKKSFSIILPIQLMYKRRLHAVIFQTFDK